MYQIVKYLNSNFKYLFDVGYKLAEEYNNGSLNSFVILKSSKENLLYCFSVEKGRISILLSGQTILQEKGNQDKYCDLFYVTKLLNPNISYSEIAAENYPLFVLENFSEISKLFSEENVRNTFRRVHVIMKDYDKVRWKVHI